MTEVLEKLGKGRVETVPSTGYLTSGAVAPDDHPEVFGNRAKIWTLYNTEATKEDQALSRNISEDMNSILVFAGLFSATVTAFLVESYRNLQPDPNSEQRAILVDISRDHATMVQQQAMMVHALLHISRQLANESNISFIPPVAVPQVVSMINGTYNSSALSFKPTKADFACNVLWFLSLLCCLGCALAACLAQQWARHFVQTTEKYTLPADRSRIRTYLLRGLRRFHMENVVACAIPMLLHASLFLFFGGLSLFLLPVNRTIGRYSFAILIVFIICYLLFTILPLFYSDCPYNTPVSRWCLHGVNYLRGKGYLRRFRTIERIVIPHNTFEKSAHSFATRRSAERDERDSWVMQMTVRTLDNDGGLLKFLTEQCTSKDAVDKSRLASLMNNTDLALRFNRIFSDFETMIFEEQIEHIMSCLDIAEKIRRSRKDFLRKPAAQGIAPRGHFDGEEHMAIAFAAYTGFVAACQTPGMLLPLKIDKKAVKRRLGQYAFGTLWNVLSRLFHHAQTLRNGVIQLRPSDSSTTHGLLDNVNTPGLLPNAPTTPIQTGDPDTTNSATAKAQEELWALITAQQDELIIALSVFESRQLEPMAALYPFLDEIHTVWTTFMTVLNCTSEVLKGYSDFSTPARNGAVENMLSDYEDILIHIHYLQLLALFHSASQCFTGALVKEPQWDRCHDDVVKNAKELSEFRPRSQKKLAKHIQLYFDHRLQWSYRGCRFTLKDGTVKSKEKPSYADLHLENPSILLLSSITDTEEIKAIIDGLKKKLVEDERRSDANDPESKDRLMKAMKVTGTEYMAQQHQNHARGRVIEIAEILNEANGNGDATTTDFILEDQDWMNYRENYKNYIFRANSD